MGSILLDLPAIKTLLPHREPMLLLDSAEIINTKEITGIYHVRGDEFFLKGHYNDTPLVPGNMQSEMLAQLGAVLIYHNMAQPDLPFGELRKNRTPLLAGLDNVRFKHPVKPRDTLTLYICLTKDTGLLVNAEGTASIGRADEDGDFKTAMTADLILAFV